MHGCVVPGVGGQMWLWVRYAGRGLYVHWGESMHGVRLYVRQGARMYLE